MRFAITGAIMVGILVVGAPTAQASDPSRLSTGYFKGLVSHTTSVLTSPLAWHSSNWIRLTLIMSIATIAADDEEELQAWVQKRRNTNTDRIAGFVRPFGDGKYTMPALATLYAYGHFADNTKARRTALLGVESFIINGVLTGIIKHVTHKHRPAPGNLDDVRWDGPDAGVANRAFPSGHTSSAFAVATVVASEYEDTGLVGPLAYGAATLCGLSRMNDNAHWLSDVIIGAALGHFTARAVMGMHGRPERRCFEIQPALTETRAGLSLAYRF